MAGKKTGAAAPAAKITDKRFASFETDPRFRLPSRKHAKTTLDKRFSGLLKDNDFTATSRVDRYGRKIKSDSKKKALERLYQLEGEEEEEEEESSDGGDTDKEEEDLEAGDEDNDEVEDDEVVQRELDAANRSTRKYDPAREGGFSSSEDESDEDEDDAGDDEEVEEADRTTGGDMRRLEREDVEIGDVTNRIAIVNLDWDHVKSTDLMALFTSFIPAGNAGKISNISVYPSEFGKERMQQEETEGPPKELFGKRKKGKGGDDEEDEESASDSEAEEAVIKKKLIQEGNDQDFDSDALRAYQLDRLRYYYAVMTCSSKEVAKLIYDATDGTEYQSSSNFIDLRFVPDEVTFDDEPRDLCEKMPESYKPIEFVTNALQSSKVKLTWDMHPEEISRKDSIKRAFKGSRAEIDEQDLKAYLAGDSSDSDEDVEEDSNSNNNNNNNNKDDTTNGEGPADGEPKLSKKELARRKMREALGLTDEPARKSKDGPVGGMQVTFTPALSETAQKKKKASEQGETTIEKYARKEKERKEKKRQAAKAKRDGLDTNADADGDGDAEVVEGAHGDGEDLGFDDPFFTTAAEDAAGGASSKTSVRKEERRKKREAKEAALARDLEEKSHLANVMAQDRDETQADHLDHFNMNDILRAEKQKSKKTSKNKKLAREAEKKGELLKSGGNLQEDFEMDVKDERFKAIFDSHEFAIDPSNPRFKATEGMKKLLEEGRKKRKMGAGEEEEEVKRTRSTKKKAKTGRR